jgi:hypothetical protein
MATFGPFSIATIADVAKAFRSLSVGLMNLGKENLKGIGHPWHDFVPRIVDPTGALAITITRLHSARYTDVVGIRTINFYADCDFAGAATAHIWIEIPGITKNTTIIPVVVNNLGVVSPLGGFLNKGTPRIDVYKATNFVADANALLAVNGSYEIEP